MIKRLAIFIPTRERDCALQLANQVAEEAEYVYVLGRDVKFNPAELHPSVKFIKRTDYCGLACVRNMICSIALNDTDAKYILMIDDDVRFDNVLIPYLIDMINMFPGVAGVGSSSRVTQYWSRDVVANGPYTMGGISTQMALFRASAVRELYRLYDSRPFGNLNALDDLRFGVRLWHHGFPLLRTNDPDMVHQVIVPHTIRRESQGGQPIKERSDQLPEAIKELQQYCGETGVLKTARVRWNEKTKQNHQNVRYNYEQMCKNAIARWGEQGYRDNKGRHW